MSSDKLCETGMRRAQWSDARPLALRRLGSTLAHQALRITDTACATLPRARVLASYYGFAAIKIYDMKNTSQQDAPHAAHIAPHGVTRPVSARSARAYPTQERTERLLPWPSSILHNSYRTVGVLSEYCRSTVGNCCRTVGPAGRAQAIRLQVRLKASLRALIRARTAVFAFSLQTLPPLQRVLERYRLI